MKIQLRSLTAGTYDLVAKVTFLDGDVENYTIASSGLADGNELFWGISTTFLGSPIKWITFTYGGDEIGIDEVYYVAYSPGLSAVAAAVPEPSTLALMLLTILLVLRLDTRR